MAKVREAFYVPAGRLGLSHSPTAATWAGGTGPCLSKKWAKAGSKLAVRWRGGISYWLGVTWSMRLNQDATCTDLLLWGGNQHHFGELGGGEERVEGEGENNSSGWIKQEESHLLAPRDCMLLPASWLNLACQAGGGYHLPWCRL